MIARYRLRRFPVPAQAVAVLSGLPVPDQNRENFSNLPRRYDEIPAQQKGAKPSGPGPELQKPGVYLGVVKVSRRSHGSGVL